MSSDLLSLLLSFQPDAPELQQKRDYDHAARQFVIQLYNVQQHYFLKGADTPQDVLSILNPAVNTIAYAISLRLRISAALDKQKSIPDQLQPGGALWNRLLQFLETFDPVQVRYVGSDWRRLVDFFEQIARQVGTPGDAIATMRSTMLRLDPTTGTFTSTHLYFIRLCMEERAYAEALPILDNYIHSQPSRTPAQFRENLEYSVPCADTANSAEYIHIHSGFSERMAIADVQEYYVLGAMAYIGVRQFKKAMLFLEHVLVVPSSNVASGLMLEAYKKWVLVSCLVRGASRVTTAPRTVNGTAFKQVKAASKAYDALADAFAPLNNLPKLRAQINAGKDLWKEDGNTGLVHELLDHHHRFYISRLSQTFSAIPVSKIASNVGGSNKEVTAYLESLITEGHLNARIERTDKVILRFFLDPTHGPLAKTEKQQQQALFEQTERTNMLAEQVKNADYRLSLTKEYIEHLKRLNKKTAGGGGSDAMDVSWDEVDAEEDIMA
ncbi:hypothetical protein BDV95DRAFT_509836 [Massariosphaeria phaeospora]|uniref:COP9 signalosome complex subunit 3 n=1 Tax=Massariosphaeria phaeospora TaxID=100035 RepID=A0A7C8IF61_9PLEO|nr:hypothetical protein BDV95DRAFT_509836 [Massariosphaeria phaeospora]